MVKREVLTDASGHGVPLPLGERDGLYWCMGCHGQFPMVAMTFSNPTVESDDAALCALLEPLRLCRGCVGYAQNRMLPNRLGWRRRAPENES